MLKKTDTNGFKGWIHEELDWSPAVSHIDELLKSISAKGEQVLHCRGRDIYRIDLPFQGSPSSCFVYFFRNTSFSRSLKSPWPFKIMRISQKMRSLGFPSFEVLAALRPADELRNRNSLLIAREILDVRELPATGNHVYKVHESLPFTGEVVKRTAIELARFHDAGLVHGDLKSRHVLFSGDPGDADCLIYFVDLEKTRHCRFLPALARDILAARDIIQLLTSLPDEEGVPGENEKSRFLSLYLGERSLGDRRRKRIRRFAGFYLGSGSFRQGETLLQGLKRIARR